MRKLPRAAAMVLLAFVAIIAIQAWRLVDAGNPPAGAEVFEVTVETTGGWYPNGARSNPDFEVLTFTAPDGEQASVRYVERSFNSVEVGDTIEVYEQPGFESRIPNDDGTWRTTSEYAPAGSSLLVPLTVTLLPLGALLVAWRMRRAIGPA